MAFCTTFKRGINRPNPLIGLTSLKKYFCDPCLSLYYTIFNLQSNHSFLFWTKVKTRGVGYLREYTPLCIPDVPCLFGEGIMEFFYLLDYSLHLIFFTLFIYTFLVSQTTLRFIKINIWVNEESQFAFSFF